MINVEELNNEIMIMKFYNIYNELEEKVGEMAVFSDGWAYLHYTIKNIYPKNEWNTERSLKLALTKSNWSYREVE